MAAGVGSSEDADFARAFQALSEAEQHASLLESRLDALEGRIAAFLDEHADDPQHAADQTGNKEEPEPDQSEKTETKQPGAGPAKDASRR